MKLSSSTLLACVCLSLGCALARARIGETEKQCEELYGKARPVPTDKSLFAYCKPPLLLALHFTGGRCDFISYVKADEATPEIRAELSDEEQDLLRKANGGAREWKISPADNDKMIHFETTDGELGSLYVKATRILIILTRDANKRFDDQAKAMDGEDSKGTGK